MENLDKNNNQDANNNTLNTSTCNLPEEENSMSYKEYVIQNTRAEIHMERAINDIVSINNTQYNASMVVTKANLYYIARLVQHKSKSLCILHEGADTRVFGYSWLPLFTVGPHTKKADIIGFDEMAARKKLTNRFPCY